MMLVITHAPHSGTTLSGTVPGDGLACLLRDLGWRWSRDLQCWHTPADAATGGESASVRATRRLLARRGALSTPGT